MVHELRTPTSSISQLETSSDIETSSATCTQEINGDMSIKSSARTLYERVQTVIRLNRKKEKRALEISAPFDSKLVPVSIPGVTEEDLAILREKAAASRIGIAESIHSQSTPCLTLEIPRRTRSPYARAPSPLSASSSQHHPIW